jgi:UDP-N-acetylmuramoylalanine--D-glutamate ligase
MVNRVIILGAGESGTGAALLAKAKGYDVFVSDIGNISDNYKQQLVAAHIEFEESQHTDLLILNADLVIKSPGIPEKTNLITQLLDKGVEVIDELEFASRFTAAKLIAITGTNGKTTTTLLTYHLLKEAGCKVGLAGNVGESLAKQVINDDVDYYVIEMSSFQIDRINTMSPEIVVMLNISPDHLDRYGYDFSNYSDAKMRLVKHLKADGDLIYFADDREIQNQLASVSGDMAKHEVSLLDSNAAAFAENGEMTFEAYTIAQADTTLRGKHNLINTMSAVLVAQQIGLKEALIRKGLKTFKNAAHRLEYVGTIQQVDFYNDSKATNVEATKYALESFEENMVWIAGGLDKGNNYASIMEQVNAKVKALVCLGKDNDKLREAFHNDIISFLETDNVHDAVKSAMKYAQANDVVLLSPACASFDLFDNYEDRGDQFKKAVMMLKKTYDN